MFIFEEIGRENGKGIDGQEFARELQFLTSLEEIKEVNVLINSPGGNVLDALSIFLAIHTSEKPVNTVIAGLAASSAGFVAMAGHKRKMNDFARLMIHGMLVENKDGSQKLFLSDKEKNAITQMRDIVAQIFENNSKKTFNDMVAIMSREVWIGAELALNLGMIDEIIDTKRPDIKFTETSVQNVYNSYKEVLPVVEKKETPLPKPKSKKMEKVANHLKLNADASQESVVEAVKVVENSLETANKENVQYKEDLDTANKRIKELEGKVSDSEKTATEANDAAAAEYVTNKIEAGVFAKDKETELLKAAKNDLVGFKALTDSIQVSGPSLTDTIKNASKSIKVDESKTLRELEKENPKAIEAMVKNDLTRYKELYKSQYGVEFKG